MTSFFQINQQLIVILHYIFVNFKYLLTKMYFFLAVEDEAIKDRVCPRRPGYIGCYQAPQSPKHNLPPSGRRDPPCSRDDPKCSHRPRS